MIGKTKSIVATYIAWRPFFQFVPPMFRVVAIAGFAPVSRPCFMFEPTPTSMVVLCMLAAYNAPVLYVIHAS